MAQVTPRILDASRNLALAAATVITASSEDVAGIRNYLRQATPTKTWRSLLGWNIVASFNDRLDFNEAGTPRAADLTVGNYATGAAAAAMIQARMDAQPGANTYTVSYDVATKKIAINRATGTDALVLKFAAGAPNFSRSVHPCLGYTSTDKSPSGGDQAIAEAAAYKSREWVRFDLGSALAFKNGIAHKHNLGSAHTVTLLAKSASDVWNAPTLTQALTGDELTSKRLALDFSETTLRYVLFLFEDTGNAAGFSELGVPYVGGHFQFGRGFVIGRRRAAAALTQIARADYGALQIQRKAAPKVHTVRFSRLSRADRETYQAIEDARAHFFLAFDPQNRPGVETRYGTVVAPLDFEEGAGDDRWSSGEMTFAEDEG